MLEWFLVPAEQQYSFIGKLSGGEQRRLYLLRTLMDQPNVLLLDEPTNDLDIQTLTVLEDYLDQFAGMVVAVSHDRYFLDRVADFILAFESDGTIREYPGNYSLYREMRARDAGSPPVPETSVGAQHAVPLQKSSTDKSRRLSFKEKRELEAVEARMAALEARLPELEAEMAVAATNYAALRRLQEEKEAAETELDAVLERWLELSEIRDNG
jgi:ATP-binding cassette subfamily F protein uup